MPKVRGPIRGTHHIDKRAARLLRDEASIRAEYGDILTTQQLAFWLGYAVITVELWRAKGNGPPFFPIHGGIRYGLDAVIAWLKQIQCTSTPPERRRPSRRPGNGAALPETNPNVENVVTIAENVENVVAIAENAPRREKQDNSPAAGPPRIRFVRRAP